jgi:hypothetical protein
LLGQGSNGVAVNNTAWYTEGATLGGGGGGSGGSTGGSATNSTYDPNGGWPGNYTPQYGGNGAAYGAGGGASWVWNPGGSGGQGAVRIIWGAGRSFPSTNTGNV